MKERGIIFSAPMVRAILDGRKTQTRRICKLPGEGVWTFDHLLREIPTNTAPFRLQAQFVKQGTNSATWCPYADNIGDRLWVRETHHAHADGENSTVLYRADDGSECYEGPWTPAIHMPRWASRITLEVTGVRVERLQEITEEDARAEGMEPGETLSAKGWYRGLWDGINGKRGNWASNPWVWVVEFKRVEGTDGAHVSR